MGQTITQKIKRYWRKKTTKSAMPQLEEKKSVWQKIKEIIGLA